MLWSHAQETNDIFLLAAKVIATVLCKARALSESYTGKHKLSLTSMKPMPK